VADPRTARAGSQWPRHVGPLRVLLAEDSLVNQKLAVALLETQGHFVTVANHGREALDALDAHRFDLALMDVQMPEMDGLEVTGVIRQREKRTGDHLPIIAMTAHALKGDCERCLAAGMDGYIAKPIHAKELFALIEQVLTPCGGGSASEPAGPEAASASTAEVAAMPEPVSDSPGESVIDWGEASRAVRGDPDLLKTVVEVALEEIPKLVEAIRAALNAADGTALRLHAHTLKGSLRYFGSTPAFEQSFRMEQLGQAKDFAEAGQVMVVLEMEVRRIVRGLESRPDG
jgi:CheY-like chemotaxis protein